MSTPSPDITSGRQNTAWLDTARRYLGTREIPGKQHNPRVLAFFRSAGHGWVMRDEVPWCAAFVGAVLEESGLKGTGKLTARSYLDWGQPLKAPREGAIAIFRRGRSNWQGHVGFVIGADRTHITLLGGNQSDSVSMARYPRSKLLGLRWPWATSVTSRSTRDEAQDAMKTLTVATALNLRTAPKSLGGTVTRVLGKGSRAHRLETWHRIRTADGEGWCSAAHFHERSF